MITATQEKYIPSPGKGPMIYFDASSSHTRTKLNGTNSNLTTPTEAILDRIVKIEIILP